MRFKAPHFPKTSVLLADPNPFTLKLIRDLCREAGIRHMYEVMAPADLPTAVAAYAIDVYVLDQRVLQDPASNAWGILQARTGADGVAPALALYGLPRQSDIMRARQYGIYCALSKPFAPRDFWVRLGWLAQRAEPSPALAAVEETMAEAEAALVG
jgi:CheY-like chemotaxis protein